MGLKIAATAAVYPEPALVRYGLLLAFGLLKL